MAPHTRVDTPARGPTLGASSEGSSGRELRNPPRPETQDGQRGNPLNLIRVMPAKGQDIASLDRIRAAFRHRLSRFGQSSLYPCIATSLKWEQANAHAYLRLRARDPEGHDRSAAGLTQGLCQARRRARPTRAGARDHA